ncbi:ATP-dependent DNA helicase RecG [Polynucleobacter sp. SHI8]|uniref:ATP-dependent DNA helicase RecG n=1 Tax=unclassified Polynucleobacter TaxID=2640945 RepID=UPI002492AF22|nr:MULTISPECIES: ATP-dependent DNA helicase RecG [unclassified Polynucleobacter]BDW11972.1 ATP-dependent DNA helicase RecG [Polynucleobacter sp. SHI2]BDW14419.1 ATP-dependent DNA helicase RecG [Polynucleobacter sp. SHI8]
MAESKSPLSRLGLNTPASLALHLPIRYEDETALISIAQATSGISLDPVQTQGKVIQCEVKFRPRRQLVVTIADVEGELILRFLNFYPSQQKQMAVGNFLRVRGEVKPGFFGPEMVHPSVKSVLPETPLPDQLTPIYSTIAGVSQLTVRRAIEKGLKDISVKKFLREIIPLQQIDHVKYAFLKELPSLEESIFTLHYPTPQTDKSALLDRTHPAWRRIQFEELLAQQISLQRAHIERKKRKAVQMPLQESGLVKELLKLFPFTLTNAQQKVWSEIVHDLANPYPMNRLLQGDVGSGKTAVAALAAAHAIDQGYQVAFMAPTEILAEQHYQKLLPWFSQLNVEITWLTGSLKAKDKKLAQEKISSGKAQLAIGTHALIQEGVEFSHLGLAIIDEQHRFGVRQRLQFHGQQGQDAIYAHQLMMSATPIPRTLAMTYYADLEVSVIDELPPGRTPIITKTLRDSRRPEVVLGIREELKKGRQAYWVCPLIEESEVLQLQTVVDTYEALSQELAEFNVGMIHGKMSSEDKSTIMQEFKQGTLQLLVSTTVIEVGVDVPNASLMVIEHAERFGYSQIHQLRGRVGRGKVESVCILLYGEQLSMAAKERLKVLRENTDGFVIAEHDLLLRGPGELLGAKQSGEAMLRFIDLQRDAWLVSLVKDFAHDILITSPQLAEHHLQRWLGSRVDYLKA